MAIELEVYQKMISEMNEKKIADSKRIASDIQKMISLFLAKKSHPSISDDKIGRRLTVDKKIFY